jgi:hypothetical protein
MMPDRAGANGPLTTLFRAERLGVETPGAALFPPHRLMEFALFWLLQQKDEAGRSSEGRTHAAESDPSFYMLS